ncbi:serpin family protein [Sphingomonas lutea]|uniref:Serpin family protein n=1 Tax=Sphingomonas lutea TaxID=1045317 RepID=A0A7G9SJA9_9SPHN|nr:serpin family protein [Sphingomonas lutea]QNN67934.1 serpin family protein [Sphingomonas lutea]
MRVLLILAALVAAPLAAQEDEPKPNPKEAFVLAEIGDDGAAVVAGLNRFGLDLYAQVRGETGDLAISPASAATAFGLAYAGANGATEAEIARVLHFPAVSDFHGTLGGLLKSMELKQNGRTLAVNNALWLQHGLKLRPEYVSLVAKNYGAGLQWVDYRKDREAARLRVNAWVESKTNNRIRGLLQPANVPKDTRSILVNTIYFKADWHEPFDARATKPGDFTLGAGGKIKLPLMHRKLRIPYVAADGAKAVALPYRGGETEMVLLLPDKADGLAALERRLTADALAGWTAKLRASRDEVMVTLPKFRIQKRIELVEPLRNLGMHIALSDASDFSKMKVVDPASRDREDWNFKIGAVVQQVFVEVEEKGTEAAAATAVVQVVVTGARVSREPKVFTADHPFLFLIRDRRTNAVLFVGRYTGEGA